MPIFSGSLLVKPMYQDMLGTNGAFDPKVKKAYRRLEQAAQKPTRAVTVTLGEVQDFTNEELSKVGLNPSELAPTALVATLTGERELKGLVPFLRRLLTGYSNPTPVNELLMLSDGKKGLGVFMKATQKALAKTTFWSTFAPLKNQVASATQQTPLVAMRLSPRLEATGLNQPAFSIRA